MNLCSKNKLVSLATLVFIDTILHEPARNSRTALTVNNIPMCTEYPQLIFTRSEIKYMFLLSIQSLAEITVSFFSTTSYVPNFILSCKPNTVSTIL